MKTYLVKLHLQLGEYEKEKVTLAYGDNELQAALTALEDECHGEWRYIYSDDGGIATIADGETGFTYTATRVVPVSKSVARAWGGL